jgi:hypothetical protein
MRNNKKPGGLGADRVFERKNVLVFSCGSGGQNVNAAIGFVVLDHAFDQSEEGVVAADANILAGAIRGAALADENIAGENFFAAVTFDTETLAYAVASVVCAAFTFFMCHEDVPFRVFESGEN